MDRIERSAAVEATQEARAAADTLAHRIRGWDNTEQHKEDVAAILEYRQAAFNAGRASAVEWLRDDANMTEIEARRILGNLVKLTPAETNDWAKLILMKHGIADALERLP